MTQIYHWFGQCGIISKLRHYAPRYRLLEYYTKTLVPILWYGILIYGCCSYSSLEYLFQLQNRILISIYFRKRRDSSHDIFLEIKFLSVFEFHVYELLKIGLHAVAKFLSQKYFNDLFSFEKKTRATRPICKKKSIGFPFDIALPNF